MTLWDRRFAKRRSDPRLDAFLSSIHEDRFLWPAEIGASRAYAGALRRAGEHARIRAGLATVKARIEGGEDLGRFEDIHSAVELMLTEEIGEAGKKLHTGRSRNEQVVVDERLFLKTEVPRLVRLLRECQRTVVRLAERHPGVIMPAYTHLQPAQCVLFSHYVMSAFWPLERAKSRLLDALERIDVLPLGVGALAGSTVPIDRKALAKSLGFAGVSQNSMDTVSDRGFILETLFVLALLLLDLSRIAEDLVVFSSREFGYLVLDDAVATSSSLMPQKKNPDVYELIRAAAGRLFGQVAHLYVTAKGLPSTYNKDLQDDKVPLRQGIEEAARVLEVFRIALSKIRPDRRAMAKKIEPALFATDLADYLARRGVPFREAHGAVAEVVRVSEERRKPIDRWTASELRKFHPRIGEDAKAVFSADHSIGLKRTSGSTHPDQVKAQVKEAKRLIASRGWKRRAAFVSRTSVR
jgi:argininosuccinate lyase